MSAEVVDITSGHEEDYKKICGLSKPDASWNGDQRQRDSLANHMNFCWVHGWHNYSTHSDYCLTVYTDMDQMHAECEKHPGLGLLSGQSTKNILNIRDHDQHEWDFVCDKNIVHFVSTTLCRHPHLLQFVLKHGLTTDLSIYFAERMVIDNEYRTNNDALYERVGRIVGRLFHVTDKDGNYLLTPDGKEYIVNPEFTAAQRNKKYRPLVAFFNTERKVLKQKKLSKIAKLLRDHKENPLPNVTVE